MKKSTMGANRAYERLTFFLFYTVLTAVAILRSATQKPPTEYVQAREQPTQAESEGADQIQKQGPLVDAGMIEVAIAIASIGFAIRAFAPTSIDLDLTRWIPEAFYTIPFSLADIGGCIFLAASIGTFCLYQVYFLEWRRKSAAVQQSPVARMLITSVHALFLFLVFLVPFVLISLF